MPSLEDRVKALEKEVAERKRSEEMLTIAVCALVSKEALEKLEETVNEFQEQSSKLFNVIINQNALHNERLTDLQGQIIDLEGKLDGRVAVLDNKIDQRFTELDSRVTTLDNKVDQRFTELDDKITEHTTRYFNKFSHAYQRNQRKNRQTIDESNVICRSTHRYALKPPEKPIQT
ncbi:MAG TPA: hypothetical protein VKV19_13050 [Ktedonobacteraceae bacterium]|nr:hypothetical protein [Ktedonobacteraceae bacterium]